MEKRVVRHSCGADAERRFRGYFNTKFSLYSRGTSGRNFFAALYRLLCGQVSHANVKTGKTVARQMRNFVRRFISLRDHNVFQSGRDARLAQSNLVSGFGVLLDTITQVLEVVRQGVATDVDTVSPALQIYDERCFLCVCLQTNRYGLTTNPRSSPRITALSKLKANDLTVVIKLYSSYLIEGIVQSMARSDRNGDSRQP